MAATVYQAIIGTAGHIDHGKTALIKALTGHDTDRLREERERGISIELGFAYLTLPDGKKAGVIDVPGHERFIRNMLAGAHGIDLVLFTVAADDGVMPQTEEHFDILHLLGVPRALFVISKADLADDARIAEVREELEILAAGTRFEGSPVIPVSVVNGRGLAELREQIAAALAQLGQRRSTARLFRMPVDRSFVLKGHGRIVTGTAIDGKVQVGQHLMVLPSRTLVRVRTLQTHGENAEEGSAGQRIAINLASAERVDVARGDVLADERLTLVTNRFDARLTMVASARKALQNNHRLRLFVGTTETLCRVVVLEESGEIRPKSTGLAQLITRDPVAVLARDRFILRDEANLRTVGGGYVLNPLGRRSRRPLATYRQRLAALEGNLDTTGVAALLELQDTFGLNPLALAQILNSTTAEVEPLLAAPTFVEFGAGDERIFTTRVRWEELKSFVLATLARYHQRFPLAPGIEMEELRLKLPFEVPPRLFRTLVERLAAEAEVERDEATLRLRTHQISLAGEERRLADALLEILDKAHFQPPDLNQLAGALKTELSSLRPILAALEKQNKIVKVTTDLHFAAGAVARARKLAVEALRQRGQITAAEFRDLLGASRRFAIALLDYFDRTGLTMRVGDVRRLRSQAV